MNDPAASHRHFMAFVKCPECQNPVSTIASTCPKCGAPINKNKIQLSPLRVFLILIGVLGLFLSFYYGSVFGIIVSVIFILLAAVAK
jgi:predicted amidophosphoribosyltransferase